MNSKKIYNLKQIEGACVIGSPIVAGILIAHNYRRFGEERKALSWIFIGILWTIALFGIGSIMPDHLVRSAGMVIPLLNGAILYPIINRLQGKMVKDHFDNGGEKGSTWKVVGLTVFFAALILVPLIMLNRVSPINQYARQEIGSSGIFHNQEMPIDDVKRLGGILQRIEYFNPEAPGEAVFLSNDSVYELKLIVQKSMFDDETYLLDISQVFKHIGRYSFVKPVVYKITDPLLVAEKTILLDNYNSIPDLLEVIPFKANSNFRLIYDLSMETIDRERFQNLVLKMNDLFPSQAQVDFMIYFEENTYTLNLFIPSISWTDRALLYEAKMFKEELNSSRFLHPFRLVLMDNTTEEVKEKEII